MRDSSTHIEHDILAAYAVDLLTPEEIVAIGSHLQSCTQCQQEVASLRATVGLLPYSLTEVQPPAYLRDRVLNAAITGRPVPRRAASPPAHGRATGQGWLRRLAPGLAVLTFALGLLLGRAWPAANPGLPTNTAGQVVALSGQGSGTVLVANNHSYVRLTIDGLPPLESGKVYQLWFLGGGAPISGGTFAANPDGSGQFEINGLAWSPEYTSIAITIEPSGGNTAPTSDIVAKADL